MRAGSKNDIIYIKNYILKDLENNVLKENTIKYLHFKKHYSYPTLYKYYKIVSKERLDTIVTKRKLNEIEALLNEGDKGVEANHNEGVKSD
ncbi:MAG: hypothetical protein QXU98_08150 [Candidatus Parvarchaeota archaeon]